MWNVDGARGEGGGQILRTALSLSLLTGEPLSMTRIRAGRQKPGLLRQHLAAVRAAAEVSGAEVEGAELGSKDLVFRPSKVRGGEYHFDIGSAGSASLVVQTLLVPLILADKPSRVTVRGGTHNPLAPPYEFLAKAFLPLLSRLGAEVSLQLVRAGFYPAGAGELVLEVRPGKRLGGLELLERGEVRRQYAIAKLAHLPKDIGVRETKAFAETSGWDRAFLHVEEVASVGPGNALVATVECAHVTEVFTAFGERGKRAETLATDLALDVQRYLGSGVPVGEHLADQLLLPLAFGAGGTFRTHVKSGHLVTQAATLHELLGTSIRIDAEDDGTFRVHVPGRS